MSRRGTTPEFRALLDTISVAGWEIRQGRRSSHWKVCDASGRMVAVMSNTPSDHRAIKNTRSQLRHAGLDM